ncbi:hypothetical protein QQX98_000330 [Neonectria punicea]|uniref:Uncharacterized protein n=1 Tax=Neonectria punicea TaxID=979145 RepID=A0ABR1HU46_9HYPO
MCYKVITHTLVCDIRPLISDGKEFLVDPFAKPTECHCGIQREMKKYFRCDKHKCCMVTCNMVSCPTDEKCEYVIPMQRYNQASFKREKTWEAFQTADEYIFPEGLPFVCDMTEHFLNALVETLYMGQAMALARTMLTEAQKNIETVRRQHRARYPLCKGLLNEWKCADMRGVAKASVQAATYQRLLNKQVELFDAKFWQLQFNWKEEADVVELMRLVVLDLKKALDGLPELLEIEKALAKSQFEFFRNRAKLTKID